MSLATPLLRLRSDEQLVTLFRDGHDEAFGVIHDRYHRRLFAYTRQMLPRPQDAEDALQDVFVRVYSSLRASDRDVANLRPWLYRAAHNRCVDELRSQSSRPTAPPDVMTDMRSTVCDPVAELDERESLQRVLEDVRRLPDQQRSALLLRELGGIAYADIAAALGVSVPAVKSLLVRARMTLASSLEARETSCVMIREELTLAHDRGARPAATARAHLRDCEGCRDFRRELRGASRQLAGLVPALGPIGILANALGFGGAGSGATAGGGTAVVVGGGGVLGSAGVLSAGHVATLIAAAVATAGGAVELRNTLAAPSHPAPTRPALVSNPRSSVQAAPRITVAPSAGSATGSVRLRRAPASTRTVRSIPAAASTTTSDSNAGASPIHQPSTTGIGAVSAPSAVPTSAIGHTSITGTADVSAAEPSPTSQAGGSSSAPTGSGSSGSTNAPGTSTSSTSNTPSSSPQTTGSGSTQPTPSSSSPGSTTWGTTGTDAAGS